MFHRDEIKGFKKGMAIMEKRKKQLRVDLMKALNVNTTAQFYNYRNGVTRLTNPQVLAVTEVFETYGIRKPFDMEKREKAAEEECLH